jgi:hypothetical protein
VEPDNRRGRRKHKGDWGPDAGESGLAFLHPVSRFLHCRGVLVAECEADPLRARGTCYEHPIDDPQLWQR